MPENGAAAPGGRGFFTPFVRMVVGDLDSAEPEELKQMLGLGRGPDQKASRMVLAK